MTIAEATPAVDKSGDRVRAMFGEIAPRYDFLNHLLSLNIDRLWRRRVIKEVPPLKTAPILDVCTGTGDLALAYFKRTAGRVPIVGIDFCEPMLRIGREKVARQQAVGSVQLLEGDAQSLPFSPGTFQIVTVAFGLRNVSDTRQGLAELVRVCQPGGQVAILEFTHPRRWPIAGLYRWYFKQVLPRIGHLFSRSQSAAYEYLPASVGEFPQYEAMTQLMEQAGLTQTRMVPLSMGIATLYVGTK